MHGVPKGLKLSAFYGLSLRAVDFLENIAYFRFGVPGVREIEIGVEGLWELESRTGELVLEGAPLVAPKPEFQLLPLGSVVEVGRVDPPRSFELHFAGGATLRFFDSSEKYESFSIPQLNVYV